MYVCMYVCMCMYMCMCIGSSGGHGKHEEERETM